MHPLERGERERRGWEEGPGNEIGRLCRILTDLDDDSDNDRKQWYLYMLYIIWLYLQKDAYAERGSQWGEGFYG